MSNIECAYRIDFYEYAPALKKFIMRYLSSSQDAEDITQEALIKAYKVASKDTVEYPKALLFKIAYNLTINHIKKNDTIVTLNKELSVDAIIGSEASPESQLSVQEELNLLYQSVLKLPPKCRLVFLMHRFHEKTYSEIAAELGISQHTVERHMVKAIAHCRKSLKIIRQQLC